MWDVIEHDVNVEANKMTIVTIYHAILEDVILTLAEKDSGKAA